MFYVDKNNEKEIIWFKLPFLGYKGGKMKRRCFKKKSKNAQRNKL